jgi:hypothetical protein
MICRDRQQCPDGTLPRHVEIRAGISPGVLATKAELAFSSISKRSIIGIVAIPHWAISARKPMSSSTTNRLSFT